MLAVDDAPNAAKTTSQKIATTDPGVCAMDWDHLIQAGWVPPYLACVWRGGAAAGTGFLVGPRHLLTALHVVCGPMSAEHEAARWRTTGVALPPPVDGERFHISFAPKIEKRRTASCVAFHQYDDLALLELDGPLHGIALPRLAEVTGQRMSVNITALGFLPAENQPARFKREVGDTNLNNRLSDEGRDHHYTVRMGAQGGFSGGPVFIGEGDEPPLLIGMLRTGGDSSDFGKMVAAPLIQDWLRQKLPEIWRTPPQSRPDPILRRGYEPFSRIAAGFDFQFAPVNPLVTFPTYIASAPIARATHRHASGVATPKDADRPAHFASADDVAACLRRLGELHHVKFRVPTTEEVAAASKGAKGKAPPGLLGEPLWLSYFRNADETPALPPDGTLEWCASRNGLALWEHGRGQLRPPSRAMRPTERCVVRLAFDVEDCL